MAEINWYEKALAKAKTFIKSIDPDLKVEIISDTSQGYARDMLRFTHAKNKGMHWNMLILTNDSYLENDFETAVKNIYKDESSK